MADQIRPGVYFLDDAPDFVLQDGLVRIRSRSGGVEFDMVCTINSRMGQQLPLWVREAAEFEPEGDHVICRWGESEWIMSRGVAEMVAARLERALAKWQIAHLEDEGTVVELPRRQ